MGFYNVLLEVVWMSASVGQKRKEKKRKEKRKDKNTQTSF